MSSLALDVVRRQLEDFLRREPLTRIGSDPEDLHQMRVACRKLRAALQLFTEYLPERLIRTQAGLKWIGQFLGAARDADVAVLQFDQWRASWARIYRQELDCLLHRHRSLRAVARTSMLSALDSRRYQRLVQTLRRWTTPPTTIMRSSTSPSAGLVEWQLIRGQLIRDLHKDVSRAARRVDADPRPRQLHRLRIRCKRLRYAMEFAQGPGAPSLRSSHRCLMRLQQVLGDYNDAATALADLARLVESPPFELTPKMILLLDQIEKCLKAREQACLKQFGRRYTEFTRRAVPILT